MRGPDAEALKLCQQALAMMIAPNAIRQTTVLHAFAVATEAEAKARAVIANRSADPQPSGRLQKAGRALDRRIAATRLTPDTRPEGE